MKKIINRIAIKALVVLMLLPAISFAGNKDRAGSAGASQLLINPWAKGNGLANANTATVRGLEGSFANIAGMSYTQKTEVLFSHTIFLGTDVADINAFGVSQKVGKDGSGGVIGLSFVNMTFGEIDITTEDLPEGGIGTYSPTLMNINLGYSKQFSASISGGINFKVISESVSNVSGTGLAIDAGIQYVTGEKENIKFGITLKNIGTPIKYTGDGLSDRVTMPGATNAMTVQQRSANFELPSLLNIGAGYDFYFSEDKYRLTILGNFTSNSFTKDIYSGAMEFSMKDLFVLRGGYSYENGQYDLDTRTTLYSGPTGGFTIKVPLNKERTSFFDLDYAYRSTFVLDGVHTIGARVNL